ncbi:MAG: hypothetical protein ASARMPRED_003534 [Alectoria sarmentosa]|nr:MAG: hypothetical protein ASARMPRED_003534 [Alectoria sarmentosa]
MLPGMSNLFHILLSTLIRSESVRRKPFGSKSYQSLDFSNIDGLWDFDPVENFYKNTIDTPDDEWWNSIFGIDHSNTTGDQALLEPATPAFGSTPSLHNNGGHSSSLYPLRNPFSAGARYTYPDIQPATDFHATSDPRFTLDLGGINETSSSLTLGNLVFSNSREAVSTGATGHGSGSVITIPPGGSYDIRHSLEQQPLTPPRFTKTSTYDRNHEDRLYGIASSLHRQRSPDTSEALDAYRAGCITSDNSVKPYFHSVEDHRRAQSQNAIDLDKYEDALVEPPLYSSLESRHKHQLGARSACDPISASRSSPRDSSLASPATIPSISATQVPPTDDIWKCDDCGRVLATKGTKNRNRNKRPHRCPGTDPKYVSLPNMPQVVQSRRHSTATSEEVAPGTQYQTATATEENGIIGEIDVKGCLGLSRRTFCKG